MENVWLSLMSKDRWSTSHWAFNLVGVRFCNDYQPWSIVSSFQIQRTAPVYQAFLYYAVIRKIFVLCHNSTIGEFFHAPQEMTFSPVLPACARHVHTNHYVLTLENCDFEIAWKFVKANLSWCLSFFYPLLHIYCEEQHNQNNNKKCPQCGLLSVLFCHRFDKRYLLVPWYFNLLRLWSE